MKKVAENIEYIGVNDRKIDLFEGQYSVPNGMAYNSYVLTDQKIAVMDTVDRNFVTEWLDNLSEALKERQPDYLIVQHMEPDHASGIVEFMQRYPQAIVVASAKAFVMMQGFFGTDFSDRRLIVGDNDTLSLGSRTLKFFSAPMVHWPEVLVTYDDTAKILFSADAFGKFGALDTKEDWACEARRYYFGIVGKYGAQVQALLKKLAGTELCMICPLHGPVLCEPLDRYLKLYDTWSSYRAESEGVLIAYTSVYGHTKAAAEELEALLKEKGCKKTVVTDLARSDMAEAVEDAFRYEKLVLATTTYNKDVFPFMRTFIEHLTERGYRGRTVGLIENGSWAPTAAKVIRTLFENSKDIRFTETTVQIKSALTIDSRAQLACLAEELLN